MIKIKIPNLVLFKNNISDVEYPPLKFFDTPLMIDPNNTGCIRLPTILSKKRSDSLLKLITALLIYLIPDEENN